MVSFWPYYFLRFYFEVHDTTIIITPPDVVQRSQKKEFCVGQVSTHYRTDTYLQSTCAHACTYMYMQHIQIMASLIDVCVYAPGISNSQILPSLGHSKKSQKLLAFELCFNYAEGKSSGACRPAINQAIDHSSSSYIDGIFLERGLFLRGGGGGGGGGGGARYRPSASAGGSVTCMYVAHQIKVPCRVTGCCFLHMYIGRLGECADIISPSSGMPKQQSWD